MNILFVLYGDFSTNTSNPIISFTEELKKLGHDCIIAIPDDSIHRIPENSSSFRACSFSEILKSPLNIYQNNEPASIIHACTPRQVVFGFVEKYMSILPTPLAIYLEDNEFWISDHYLNSIGKNLKELSFNELSTLVPPSLSHPNDYKTFLGYADVIILIQEKLEIEVPPSIPCEVIPWGIDLTFFRPLEKDHLLRKTFGISDTSKIIVYPGGLNGFTLPAIKDLCMATLLINNAGIDCVLIRTGPNPLFFIDELGPDARKYIIDVGVIDRSQLPNIMGLADIFVQPGRIDPFEDLRLPSKLPEFLGMGKPILIPNVNIANKFIDGKDLKILNFGTPDEIANECISIFSNPKIAIEYGHRARKFAVNNFDIVKQSKKLEECYKGAIKNFNLKATEAAWKACTNKNLLEGMLTKFSYKPFFQNSNNIKVLNYFGSIITSLRDQCALLGTTPPIAKPKVILNSSSMYKSFLLNLNASRSKLKSLFKKLPHL